MRLSEIPLWQAEQPVASKPRDTKRTSNVPKLSEWQQQPHRLSTCQAEANTQVPDSQVTSSQVTSSQVTSSKPVGGHELTHNKSADSQMASSQATSSKLIGLAGNKQMQPGVTDSQAIDSHAKCIKLIRQVASSQLTDSKGKQLITSSQTKSDKPDTQTGNKLTGLAAMQPGDREQAHSCRVT